MTPRWLPTVRARNGHARPLGQACTTCGVAGQAAELPGASLVFM
ncbi:hypothetical protein ACFFHJ_31520 [Planotetraspora thailandica]|nr:hypothetical protein [Planotetraspora thailandica]